ncbi:Major facilitator superfamily domain general substrate transporter [Penicillium herquei]|nr:Major facilitator superfamily domain general substrate transporter [Penicillium herquei]
MPSCNGSTTSTLMNQAKEDMISSTENIQKSQSGAVNKPAFSSSFQEAVFIFLIGLSQLFSVGGLGNTAYSTEHIGTSLGVSSNGQMSWFLASYSLVGGVFVLITGRLGDHLGHKYVFIFGWIWMAIWSLVCGFACDVVLFDIARGMMGIANTAPVPNSFALLARAFPPLSVKKNIAFAFLDFFGPSGFIFSGIIGAAFSKKVTW